MYRSERSMNPPLFPGMFHLGAKLAAGNRWLRLAEAMPWEQLDAIYGKYFSQGTGRQAKDSRLVAGLLTVKLVKNLSDDETVQEFMESPYIQSFCGAEYFAVEDVISPSLLAERRKRLGKEFFDCFDYEVPRALKETRLFRIRKDPQQTGLLGWFKNLFN